MVRTRHTARRRGSAGYAMVDLVIAMLIIVLAILPLVLSFSADAKLAGKCYQRLVADEIVDGEFERLLAGGWKRLAPGTQVYKTSARAWESLPRGRMEATLEGSRLRLEWIPEAGVRGSRVVREGRVP